MNPQLLRQTRDQIKSCLTKLEKWVAKGAAQNASVEEIDMQLQHVLEFEAKYELVQSQLEVLEQFELLDATDERITFDERLCLLQVSLMGFKTAVNLSHDLYFANEMSIRWVDPVPSSPIHFDKSDVESHQDESSSSMETVAVTFNTAQCSEKSEGLKKF